MAEFDYGAYLAGQAQLQGTMINAIAQQDINYDTRKWNEEQWEKTRAWNYEMWNKTNAYNSPVQQMKRFEDAGLNKNLMFGQGTPGNASTTTTGLPQSWNPKNPGFGDALTSIFGMLSTYQDMRVKDTQVDNMEKMGANLDLDNTRKAIDNVIRRNELTYQPAEFRAKQNMINQGAMLSEERRKYTQDQSEFTRKRSELVKTQADVMDSQILNNAAEFENKIIMNEILKNENDYKKFKQDFIQENQYSPESSPSIMRILQDVIKGGGKAMEQVFDEYIMPKNK